MSNTLILGNGFDLALNLNTRFSNYVNSAYWPFSDEYHAIDDCLYNFLYKYSKKANKPDTWIDLEGALLEYAITRSKSPIFHNNIIDFDRNTYSNLVNGFIDYLNKEVIPLINIDCKRNINLLKLFASIKRNNEFIYSFNYTPTQRILRYFNINAPVVHIHGSLDNDKYPPILGINDNVDIIDDYKFLRKSWKESYENHNLNDDIFSSDFVIFYGLSFGVSDFVYFEKFFNYEILHHNPANPKKEIHIFTYDENSRISILRGFNQANINFSSLKSVLNITIHKVSEFNKEHPLAFDRFHDFLTLLNNPPTQPFFHYKDL